MNIETFSEINMRRCREAFAPGHGDAALVVCCAEELGELSPIIDALGFPNNGRICAGWVEMRRRFLDVQRRDLDDQMRSTPVDYPLTFAVALAVTRAA